MEPAVAYVYRTNPAIPDFPDDRPIIIFDGHCVLCSRFAVFVLKHDHKRGFRFLPAQTKLGVAIATHYGIDPKNLETVVLLADGVAWFKSDGILRILRRLSLPWSLLAGGRFLPRMLRDGIYDVVARNRLHWFGVREICFANPPDYEDRFLS